MISKNKITRNWELTTNLNLFQSGIELSDPTFAVSDPIPSWQLKMNHTIKVGKRFTLQLNGEYVSKTVLPPSGSGGGRGGWSGGGGGMAQPTRAMRPMSDANHHPNAARRDDGATCMPISLISESRRPALAGNTRINASVWGVAHPLHNTQPKCSGRRPRAAPEGKGFRVRLRMGVAVMVEAPGGAKACPNRDSGE